MAGERASPAQVVFLTTLDKHANMYANSLPEYQEQFHISVHKCIPIEAGF